MLAKLTFTPQWEQDTEQGLWSVYLPEMDVFGQGSSREEAAADLVDAAREYADLYLDDVPFYFKVGRRHHFPYALAVFLASDDPARLRQLLGV